MFELRDYQKNVANIVFRYMRNNPDNHPLVGMPTGSGKTVVLADIIKQAIARWPKTKILVLSHVKEILEQDYKSIRKHTKLDVGIYSAGLGKREVKQVTVGGIQSVYNCNEFRNYNLIIIDECHLINFSETSMYQTFFGKLNKKAKYLGLTATPFRLGGGYIFGPGKMFNDMVYDLTSLNSFNKLIEDGYLCNLLPYVAENEIDTSGVKTTRGDFDKKQLSAKVAGNATATAKAVQELIKKGQDYKKWLVFAVDINHAELIAEQLIRSGISAMIIHSKMEFDRDTVISDYKAGKYRAIVNVNVLTTGFDDPEIDLIAIMRPTQSPVLHVQTIGRGLRIAPGKDHCLVLDFAGNTERLGPINDVHVYEPRNGRKKKDDVEAMVPKAKFCPVCKAIHPLLARTCQCGHVFNKEMTGKSRKAELIRKQANDWYEVQDTLYVKHIKKNTPDMVKVSYRIGARFFNEYICMNHPGYAGHKARHWATYRGSSAESTDALLADTKHIRSPSEIKVDTHGKYPIITDYKFE